MLGQSQDAWSWSSVRKTNGSEGAQLQETHEKKGRLHTFFARVFALIFGYEGIVGGCSAYLPIGACFVPQCLSAAYPQSEASEAGRLPPAAAAAAATKNGESAAPWQAMTRTSSYREQPRKSICQGPGEQLSAVRESGNLWQESLTDLHCARAL